MFGITERGDAARDLSWTNEINKVSMAILITKNIDSTVFQETAILYKHKVIVHATITGFGSTYLEPNVSPPHVTLEALSKFIKVFPASQVVLRVDPIIPTEIGLRRVYDILNKAPEGIRLRFSFIDNYKHISERGVRLPWTTFHAPRELQAAGVKLLHSFEYKFHIESCGEESLLIPTAWKIGCISKIDCDIFNIPSTNKIGAQRKACLCLAGKTELLTNRHPCPNQCSYCYWKS